MTKRTTSKKSFSENADREANIEFSDIERFRIYNRKNINDRQIDTLIGLSKGMIADNVINKAEAEYLYGWLIQNRHIDNPIIQDLLQRVEAMLEDNEFSAEEAEELLLILKKISGEPSELGELAKPAMFALDDPLPLVVFEKKVFLFTGTFVFGKRGDCCQCTESLGGIIVQGVSKLLDYLVIGGYVSDAWAHENYGRKIEKALSYRDKGLAIKIISEEHWHGATQL